MHRDEYVRVKRRKHTNKRGHEHVTRKEKEEGIHDLRESRNEPYEKEGNLTIRRDRVKKERRERN